MCYDPWVSRTSAFYIASMCMKCVTQFVRANRECEKCGDANCNANEERMEKCNETEIGQLEPNYSSERMCNAQCIGTNIE